MKFVIEKEVLEKTLSYLSTRPWQEVNNLIAALAKAEPVDKPEE